MPCLARFRIFSVAVAFLVSAAPLLTAVDGRVVGDSQRSPSCIVIGFVGGFVRHNNLHHAPVQLAQRLQRTPGNDVYVQVFQNWRTRAAYKTIFRLLDSDHDGVLSEQEKAQARIILYGHSWGASAAVMLARELGREGIPVALTVQVDSIAKFWEHSRIIPKNVVAAANFYQPHGLVHGREIVAADPSRTQILGNYRFDYKQTPVKCEGPSWLDRLLTPSHMESECDPHLWNQVEALVRQHLKTHPSNLAALPQP